MPLSAGHRGLDLKPLNGAGEIQAGVRGSHRGPSTGLNVHNPQPGFVYSWIRHPKHDRGGSQFQRFINMGYQACGPNSPEMRGQTQNMNISELGLDNYQVHGDVVLMRIREDKYAERQEFKRQQAKVAADGSTDDFLAKGQSLENTYGLGQAADGPIYHRSGQHGTIIR